MEEQTNQPTSKDLVFDPKDFAETDVQDTSNLTEDNNEQSTEKVKIKYNGQEMDLTLDELKTHAQKGLNYDKILTERDSLKNSEELAYLKELATEKGVDTKTLVKELKESRIKEKIESRAKELEASDGLTPEQALKMAQLELKANQPIKQDNPTDAIQKEFETLLKEFPETREKFKEFKDLPKPIQEAIIEGKSVTIAYAKYLVEETNKAKEQALQELDAAKRTPGALNSGQQQKGNDPFLDGFWGNKK